MLACIDGDGRQLEVAEVSIVSTSSNNIHIHRDCNASTVIISFLAVS